MRVKTIPATSTTTGKNVGHTVGKSSHSSTFSFVVKPTTEFYFKAFSSIHFLVNSSLKLNFTLSSQFFSKFGDIAPKQNLERAIMMVVMFLDIHQIVGFSCVAYLSPECVIVRC